MIREHEIHSGKVDLGFTDAGAGRNYFAAPVARMTTASIQARLLNQSSWGSGVLTIECTNDPGMDPDSWVTIPSFVSATTTISADGIYGEFDVSSIPFIRVRVTTARSGSAEVNISIAAKNAG